MYRVPTPDDNDSATVVDAYLSWKGNHEVHVASPVVKIVPATEFSSNDRWDVSRFWSEDELVALGVKAQAVDRLEFIDDATGEIASLLEELRLSKDELRQLTATHTISVALSDEELFKVRSGTRITNENIRNNPGDVPVYSCPTEKTGSKGTISERFLVDNNIPVESADNPIVTVMANGAKAVGKCLFVENAVPSLTTLSQSSL